MAAIGLDAWREAGAYFEFRGQRIFWRQAGNPDHPALLLIHGFPTASWDWAPVWTELSSYNRVIAPDLLGFGFSAKPAGHRYSIFEQADLLEALLEHLRVGRYHVLAHDYGDSVAQELLARRLRKEGAAGAVSICLLNGGLFPETHRPLPIQKLLMSPLGPLVARLTSKRSLAASLRRIFAARSQPTPELIDGFWELLTCHDGKRAMPGLIRYMRERVEQRERWVGALERSPLPLKLVDGSSDPISGAHMAARYRQCVANADVTELPDVGHYPQIEAPQMVLDAYAEFRESLRG